MFERGLSETGPKESHSFAASGRPGVPSQFGGQRGSLAVALVVVDSWMQLPAVLGSNPSRWMTSII